MRDFLKPVKASSRHIDAGDTWSARAYVAIALQVLIESGIKRRSGATIIARRFPELRSLLSPRSKAEADFADVIEGWHKRLAGDEVGVAEARIAWADRDKLIEHMRKVCSQETGQAPTERELAEVIVAQAVQHGVKQATPKDIEKAHIEAGRARRKPLKDKPYNKK